MSFSRGGVWIAGLDPTQGSEQAGTRPVIIYELRQAATHSLGVSDASTPLVASCFRRK